MRNKKRSDGSGLNSMKDFYRENTFAKRIFSVDFSFIVCGFLVLDSKILGDKVIFT